MRSVVRTMDEELIPGTTHYTVIMGNRGATRIADLVNGFAERCESPRQS
jgi:hypothetical protein